jgi:hypothetical protein
MLLYNVAAQYSKSSTSLWSLTTQTLYFSIQKQNLSLSSDTESCQQKNASKTITS